MEARLRMNIVILEGNPKSTGFCRDLTNKLIQGAVDGGATIKEVNTVKMERCRMCGVGEGICKDECICAFGDIDGFNDAQNAIHKADAYVIVSPVYFCEVTESLKSFLDKLRRCEKTWGKNKGLKGKPVILVASAGNSGHGLTPCLEQMERFCAHTGARVYDFIAVNRWNSDYKFEAAYSAAKAMASGRPIYESDH